MMKFSSSKIYRSTQNRKRKEWITNGLIVAIERKDNMKKHLRNNHNTELKEKYANYRNLLNKLIKKQKYEYYKEKMVI